MSLPPITFGGLASGLDTNSIITQLVNIEKQPITTLQTQISDDTTKEGLVTGLTSGLTTLDSNITDLELASNVQGTSFNIPSGAPFTAVTAGTPPVGSYNIGVTQLAQAQRTYSNAFSSDSATGLLNAGTVTLSVGGQTANINVTSADSLNTVAASINGAGLAVTAAVVYDGTNYRLVLDGQNTGAANAITISDPSNTGLGLNVAANTVSAAQDAKITVDGINATSTSNSFNSIIPGVNLTVNAVSALDASNNPITTTLGIAANTSTLTTALQTLATNFNAVMSQVTAQIPASGSTTPLGTNTLVGEPVVSQLQSALLGFTTTPGGPAGNTYGTLAEIGLTVDQYGTMSLNTTTLQTALANNPAAVTNLLTGTAGVMTALDAQIQTFIDPINGSLTAATQTYATQVTTDNTQITALQAQAVTYQNQLTAQFSAMEQLIAGYNSQGQELNSILGNNSSSSSSSSSSSNNSSSSSSSSGSNG